MGFLPAQPYRPFRPLVLASVLANCVCLSARVIGCHGGRWKSNRNPARGHKFLLYWLADVLGTRSMIPLDIPSLRQLRAFEAVARLESVSSAAREVNLSQPGVTQSVRALEIRLKTSLFERRRAGCYVTELGAVLLPRVRRFFHHVRTALSEPAFGSPFTRRQTLDAAVNKITRPQMRSLIAIAENDSFDAAARWLHISQPSLHRSAKELERELRRSLYQRTSRGVTTTSQGSELARRFQVALREIEYGIEEMQAARGVIVSRIAIGNIPHSGTQILSTA